MSGKSGKSNGGDWIDKLQQHNRNVALQQQADAAKARARAEQEKAHQAKLDREANDRHRAKMEAIARQNAAIEAQRLKLLQQEQDAKEFSRRQSLRLYDISCMLEQLDVNEKPLARVQLCYKLKNDFDNIVLDAITDLQYRKLYSQVEISLSQHMERFKIDNAEELSIYRKHNDLEKRIEPYLDDLKINSAKELCQAQNLLKEVKCFSAENPELAIDEEEIEFVREHVDVFVQSAAEMKALRMTLLGKGKITSGDSFDFLLCSFFKIEDDIFSSEMWKELCCAPLSTTMINDFCGFCYEAKRSDPTLSETVFQIFDSVDNPQTVPAVQMAKKSYICTNLTRILDKRNRKIEQKIVDKYNSGIQTAGAIILSSVIVGFFLTPAFFGIIPGVIIIIMEEKKKELLKTMPMSELTKILQSVKK